MTDKTVSQILETIAYGAPISGNHLAQARVLMAAKMYANKPAQPDCRTCANQLDGEFAGQCDMDCNNGNQYIETPKVVLWRTEA